ncbi:MAG: type II secretion system protein [Candidatus Eremiobacteraeota bacterium]|mgnify:FL=1|nr:type II secretion system protein [Candidatus Eremiobacteraeota bacterium]
MMRRGFSLVEILFSLGLSVIVLAGLFLLLRGSTRQFELSSSQVFLGQSSRMAVEDSLAFAASAVSPVIVNAQSIYSPVPECYENDTQFPNIYCLDFASCCDYLDPRFSSQPEATTNYLNRRGGGTYRYRIRYDLTKQQLLLERLNPGSPADLPEVDPTARPQVLAQGLDRVTFAAVGNTIHLNVATATVKKDGELQGGLQVTDGRRSLDPNAPVQQRARRLRLFTVLTIPSRTAR